MERGVELKQATIEDIPKLVEIEEKLVGSKIYVAMTDEKEWQEEIKKANVKAYLIFQDGKVVGNVSYEVDKDIAYISGLAISPEFQKMGIGKRVIGIILKELKNVRLMKILTHPENIPALKLYKSFDFVEKETIENYFGDGEPRVVLIREK